MRVTERKKDLIVTSGGKKVAPQRLENLLKSDPLIHRALVVGRGQSHLFALITLDLRRLKELAETEGVPLSRVESIATHPWVEKRVRDIVQRTNKQLAPYETIRNFIILDREFSVEAKELTPTLKPRRQVIVERNKELIESLYRKASYRRRVYRYRSGLASLVTTCCTRR